MDSSSLMLQENEILALEAIYPQDFTYTETQNSIPQYIGSFSVRVTLPNEIRVCFSSHAINGDSNINLISTNEEILKIRYLPPIIIDFSMPALYPEREGLDFTVKCCWLSDNYRLSLKNKLQEIWEEERDVVLYRYAEFIQENALEFLGITFPLKLVDGTTRLKDIIWSYNRDAMNKEFAENHFDCGICLENKPGSRCIQLQPCQHVFCQECLCGYFEMLIREGFVSQVKCPDIGCKVQTVLTKEVLDEIVGTEMQERYARLMEKIEIETNPLITYCPLKTCQTPVKKSSDFEKLCLCEKCGFAFCWMCKRTWHGPHIACAIKNVKHVVKEYLAADDVKKALMKLRYGPKNLEKLVRDTLSEIESEEWMRSNTQPCPQCDTFIEKSMGCNHMRCTRCETHFCYLCGHWIDPAEPYRHFNDPKSPCNQRLFDGTDIDELEFFAEDHDDI
ncbi:8573_t:CDS:2 [Ambispora gerdemannii]|uniref:RBR-type E3 ubiquitin transferase n=1 Tax=Ambispora gerdemannii TaxID=144530 RepID=A0A9N9FIA4_9GLOM|nr:8573_t:CDS:2 [Ambispora gerdemannii]